MFSTGDLLSRCRHAAIPPPADDRIDDDIGDGAHHQGRHHIDEGVLLDKECGADDDDAPYVCESAPSGAPQSRRPVNGIEGVQHPST